MWDYINKNDRVKNFFEKKKEENEWRYFISVAHLEELYRARKNEKDDKVGMTDSLEKTIKSMAADGVIVPTYNGLIYEHKSFAKRYAKIVEYDTNEAVKNRALLKRQLDKDSYSPQDLFDGMEHAKGDEYKNVWEVDRVKKELKNLQEEFLKVKEALLSPGNALRLEFERIYKGFNIDEYFERLSVGYDITISPAMYYDIQNNYTKLEIVMENLFYLLTRCGFKRDKSEKHANSGAYDIQHAINSTFCDKFITNDNRFADKYMAVAYFLGIPIEIIRWDDMKLQIENQQKL